MASLRSKKGKVEEAVKMREVKVREITELKLRIAKSRVKKEELEILIKSVKSSSDDLGKLRLKVKRQRAREQRLKKLMQSKAHQIPASKASGFRSRAEVRQLMIKKLKRYRDQE